MTPEVRKMLAHMYAAVGSSFVRSGNHPAAQEYFIQSMTLDRALFLNLHYSARAGVWDTEQHDAFRHIALALPDLTNKDVLDLGCGTGAVGRALQSRPRTLTGVDLCAAMVARARETGAYDVLEVSSIEDYLHFALGKGVDVITAASVFIHIGNLDEIADACWWALENKGIVAFTVFPPEGKPRPGVYEHTPDQVLATFEYYQLEEMTRKVGVESMDMYVFRKLQR